MKENDRILERIRGLPAQKGTPLTDMDPRNPTRPGAANDNRHWENCYPELYALKMRFEDERSKQ